MRETYLPLHLLIGGISEYFEHIDLRLGEDLAALEEVAVGVEAGRDLRPGQEGATGCLVNIHEIIQYTKSQFSKSRFFHWKVFSLNLRKGRHSILRRNLRMMSLFLGFILGERMKLLMKQVLRKYSLQQPRIFPLASSNSNDFQRLSLGVNSASRESLVFLSLSGASLPKKRQVMDSKQGDICAQFLTISHSCGESSLAFSRWRRWARVRVLMLMLSYLVSLRYPLSVLMQCWSMWLDVRIIDFPRITNSYISTARTMHLEPHAILQLANTTYSSTNTQDIRHAQQTLIDYVFQNYPRSFTQLEDIMVQGKGRLEPHSLAAIANLIKVAGQKILESLSLLNRAEEDVVGKHKKLLHAVEHIFDNKEIPSSLKLPVGDLYVEMFIFFSPENYQRLVSKSKFYFNTREELLSLGLIESYIHRKTPLKYRSPYCDQTLNIVIDNLLKKTEQLIANPLPSQQDHLVLAKFVQVLLELWNMMTFEKFEKSFTDLFRSNNFLKMMGNLTHPLFNQAYRSQVFTIYNVMAFSLGRCNLLHKFADVQQILRDAAVQAFEDLLSGQLAQQPQRVQTSVGMFLGSAIEFRVLEIAVPMGDLFAKLVNPNCLLVEKYLKKQADNLPEIISFLDDLSFELESQTNEVARHRVFIELCRNNESVGLAFKSLLLCFFANAAKLIPEMQQTRNGVNPAQGMQALEALRSSMIHSDLLQSILLYLALSVNLFVSDFQFMNRMQEFFCLNQQYLLCNQDQKIIFYSILLYKNYMDDIFSRNSSLPFREAIINLSLQPARNLLCNFALQTMKEKLEQRPSFGEFSREIGMFLAKMVEAYDEQIIPIIIVIFREYGEFVNKEVAISIVKETIHIWESREIQQDRLSQHLELIKLFLNIPSCNEFFMHLLQELLRIANDHAQAMSKHCEQFLEVLKTGLMVTHTLPPNFQDVVMEFNVVVDNSSTMQSLNHLIMYSTSPAFFNWLATILTSHQLNIQEILLIHNLIYFGSKFLTQNSITRIMELAYTERVYRRHNFDYRNGKINLIFLLLLNYMWEDSNHVLLTHDWQPITDQARERLRNTEQIGRVESIGVKPFIEEVYDLIYLQQNTYRWKYDIEMFLIHQLDLFKYRLKDNYQFMYANLSFIACTMNILRAYELIENHYLDSGSDSDDSLHPHSPLEKEYRQVQQILDRFALPPHLREVDYFTTYRKTVAALRGEEGSCRWMETLFQACFKDDHKSAFQNVMRMEKNQEGYRKINRIRRVREE